MPEYNYKKIGQRIRLERRNAGFSRQEDFGEALGLCTSSRQTIGKWENGKLLPSLDDFFKMCKVFDCELGYLLCEYDCKTREATDIQQTIGLSEKAINVLKTFNHETLLREPLNTLNQIIEHPEFINLLKSIHLHKLNFIDKKFSPDRELRIILSKELGCSENEAEKYLDKISESTISSTLLSIIGSLK